MERKMGMALMNGLMERPTKELGGMERDMEKEFGKIKKEKYISVSGKMERQQVMVNSITRQKALTKETSEILSSMVEERNIFQMATYTWEITGRGSLMGKDNTRGKTGLYMKGDLNKQFVKGKES